VASRDRFPLFFFEKSGKDFVGQEAAAGGQAAPDKDKK